MSDSAIIGARPVSNPSNLELATPGDRLDSWKEIAVYLARSERTVRRWEEREGLPVHRLVHDKRGSVYAYKRELDAWWELRKATIEPEDRLTPNAAPPTPGSRRLPLHGSVWMLAGILLATAVFAFLWLRVRPQQAPAKNVQFKRITDFVGLEESPAISPDGKTVAVVSLTEGRRQIWVRLLAGGTPLQITRDDADHEQPRWAPDSSSIIYYSPSPVPGDQGTIWEIPALGGSPRRIASSLGGGDLSHDGRRVALFHSENGKTELLTAARLGAGVQRVTEVATEDLHQYPRWSPDDRWIAFQSSSVTFNERVYVVSAAGGKPREVARGEEVRGFSWLGDGSGLVYSSSLGSTVLYPPIFNLRTVRLSGASDRQLTFGDVSYLQPDLQASGSMVATRVRSRSDLWRFPIAGQPQDNVRDAVRITEQTGQIQTPSVSPDGKEMVYLSDSGGHGNLWIAKTDGSSARQITFEHDPSIAVGVPVWSPVDNQIVFILTRQGHTAQWLIQSDGSGLRRVIPAGIWAYWSADGRWLYYVVNRNGAYCIEKVPIAGDPPVVVRSDNAVAPAALDDSLLYYATLLKRPGGWSDFEFRRARPEGGNYEVLARIAGTRVPDEPLNFHMILSPDGKWLATPLIDGATTNLWLLPAGGGPLRQITDFGKRSTLIVRRVSWSPDSQQLYAAVAESDADIVMLEGLVQ
jgi:Tol biopolymer transport system component